MISTKCGLLLRHECEVEVENLEEGGVSMEKQTTKTNRCCDVVRPMVESRRRKGGRRRRKGERCETGMCKGIKDLSTRHGWRNKHWMQQGAPSSYKRRGGGTFWLLDDFGCFPWHHGLHHLLHSTLGKASRKGSHILVKQRENGMAWELYPNS